MKKNILVLIILTLTVFTLNAQDALSIVRASRDRIISDTVSTRSRMLIQDRNGSVTERLIDQYSKDGPRGHRAVIVFQQPASVRGVRFLTMENQNGSDDRWIYLPALGGEPNRIGAADGSRSFQGTDFSNDDISSASRSPDLDTHTLLREESLNGSPCYVIQSVPRDNSYQYSRMVQWVDKSTMVTMKVELYNRAGVLVKLLEILRLQVVQERLSIMSTRMTTIADNTSTTLNVEMLRYNDPVPESVFTLDYLKTGRAR
ncbi:MAG: outer membrane lipoprotein-sorting protein [Treponema sp.]|jgi:outer membrane lipoprotein-sorting protein|nr:outer membrane lipoprotein-sorting protein [Treponema sp.]